MDKKSVDDLKKLLGKYREASDSIYTKINEIEQVPLANALLGKCYKFPNSYGNKKFWVYYRIVRRVGLNLHVDCFQENNNGNIEFEYGRFCYTSQFIGQKEISTKVYFNAKLKLLNKMITKLREEENQ